MVTSPAGRSSPFPGTPQWMVYLPVSRAARLGAQTGEATYHRRKMVPSLARRSRFGVAHSRRPLNPTSPQPISSARMQMMFGGAGGGSPVWPRELERSIEQRRAVFMAVRYRMEDPFGERMNPPARGLDGRAPQ